MPQYPVELRDVIYDPACQAFQAMAHVHDPSAPGQYPCKLSAPMTYGFSKVAGRMARQALRRHRLNQAKPPLWTFDRAA